MRCRNWLSALIVMVGWLNVALSAESEWPQWRGPRRDGSWHAPQLPEQWPESGLKVQWKQPLGGGYAGVEIGRAHV